MRCSLEHHVIAFEMMWASEEHMLFWEGILIDTAELRRTFFSSCRV